MAELNTIHYNITDGIATLTFDEPGSPVNTMGMPWQRDMAEAAQKLVADRPKLRGVMLASAKTSFFAGAELNGVLKLQAGDAAQAFRNIEALKRAIRTIETLGVPVVALLNGAALGGGWEVALVAHARFAIDDPRIRFGTPEVTLGLIPGATGITMPSALRGSAGRALHQPCAAKPASTAAAATRRATASLWMSRSTTWCSMPSTPAPKSRSMTSST